MKLKTLNVTGEVSTDDVPKYRVTKIVRQIPDNASEKVDPNPKIVEVYSGLDRNAYISAKEAAQSEMYS